jgi:acetyl-CoA C-acetyltransferase
MSRDVAIVGVGQTAVGEHWERSLRDLAVEALCAAIADAGTPEVQSLFVGNMMGGELAGQEHLGALVADFAGLQGIEAVRVEAACGSGAAALRLGCMAIMSGSADVVAVVGVEKMTDRPAADVTAALAMAADGDYEARQGLSFVALNALLMRRYMHEYGTTREQFAPFCINAHRNAVGNPNAMFPFAISADDFSRAKMIADPVSLLDSSPVCDGAAAIILTSLEAARRFPRPAVRVRASAIGTDTIALHDRHDLLELRGAATSAARAYAAAGVTPADIDFFEVHDAFTIMSVLSLEASGFAARGEGVRLGLEGAIGREGRVPITTMGGLKARGHPVGATGMYQLVEATLQLRGEAGVNQVPGATLGMTQNIGGSGATVVTTILEAAG